MASLGHPMMCTDGYRTWAQQNALFAKRPKVTNARGGQSNHNYACAADCTFLVNGKPTWSGNLPWDLYGKVAKKHGFEWGGDWASFPDRPHIQMTFGYSIPQLQKMGEKNAVTLLTRIASERYPTEPTTPPVAPEAQVSWDKAKAKGIISDKTNPQEEVDSATLQWIFSKLNVMQAPTKETKQIQWYIVALDRLNLL